MSDESKPTIIDLGTALAGPGQDDFEVGLLKSDPSKVLLVLAREAKNIHMPPDMAIKLGQALIKMAREAQKRTRTPIIVPNFKLPGNGK